MKHYLFYEKNHNKTIFQYKATYLWLSFAMMMSIIAVIGFITEKQLPILLVLAGLLFFPGVPIAVKNYKKAYYIQLEDMCIVCSGRINNLFRKTRMNHRQRLSRKLSVSMKKILVLRLMYSSRDVPDRERDLSRL